MNIALSDKGSMSGNEHIADFFNTRNHHYEMLGLNSLFSIKHTVPTFAIVEVTLQWRSF